MTDALLAADRCGSKKVRLFDTPPFAMCCPDLVKKTESWMKAVKEGTLDPAEEMRCIRDTAEGYRLAKIEG
ncbi:MAG: hypothetical protein Q8O43_07395 [Dehalococcoidia bacterium]|nr:hypothetical protein [Dehalococcoidia bacterium]